MRKKEGDAKDFSGMSRPRALTPLDIQQKEFGVSRLGGYKMRDVDEFLDELTEAMTQLTDENERLRGQSLLPAAPIGPPGDASREADQILARAREEAADIVRAARDQAGATGGDPAADRASIGAFLSREREFLQSLAALVQGHAEGIKELARTARQSRPAPAATEPTAASPPEPETPEPDMTPPAPESAASEPSEPTASEPPGPAAQTPSEEPIRVDEPQPASVSRMDTDDEAPPEGTDRSLRELFWGED
jgi:DivIVA domain-containing protein